MLKFTDMEPRQQALSGGHETIPATTGEYNFGLQPEKPGNNGERYEQKSPEIGSVQAEAAQVAMPALPTPVAAVPQEQGFFAWLKGLFGFGSAPAPPAPGGTAAPAAGAGLYASHRPEH